MPPSVEWLDDDEYPLKDDELGFLSIRHFLTSVDTLYQRERQPMEELRAQAAIDATKRFLNRRWWRRGIGYPGDCMGEE
jgi:hypothetical protein